MSGTRANHYRDDTITPFVRPSDIPPTVVSTGRGPPDLARPGCGGTARLAISPADGKPCGACAGASSRIQESAVGRISPPTTDFGPLKLANPNDAPADNRNGGNATMTKKDWINGRLGVPDSVSLGVHRPVRAGPIMAA